jgi:hypothetical protein
MRRMWDRGGLIVVRNVTVALFPAVVALSSSPYRLDQLDPFAALLFIGLTLVAYKLLAERERSLLSGHFTRLVCFNIICLMAYGSWSYHFYEIDLNLPKFWLVYGVSVLIGNLALWATRACRNGRMLADASLIGLALATATLASENLARADSQENETRTGTALNNIYYFIFDAHPGIAMGNLIPQRSSEEFTQELEKLGFVSAATPKSNYVYTNQTLAAIMNLDYLPEGEVSQKMLYPESVQRRTPPPLVEALRVQGYLSYNMYSAAFGCQNVNIRCILPQQSLGLQNAVGSLIGQTPLRNWKRFTQSMQAINSIDVALQRQPSLLIENKPFFLFVHHLSPHPPYHYSSQCVWENELGPSHLRSGWTKTDRPSFVSETLCLNRDIVKMARTLIARDPLAIVILQSDHGPWLGPSGQAKVPASRLQLLTERQSFLNLVRLPAKCRPEKGKTFGQVNTARLIVGCVSGKSVDFRPEKSFFPDGETGQLVRVN